MSLTTSGTRRPQSSPPQCINDIHKGQACVRTRAQPQMQGVGLRTMLFKCNDGPFLSWV